MGFSYLQTALIYLFSFNKTVLLGCKEKNKLNCLPFVCMSLDLDPQYLVSKHYTLVSFCLLLLNLLLGYVI